MKVSTPGTVCVWREAIILPTYEPLPPNKNPMFLEKRVYQGSSGKTYPVPFYDRISEEKVDRSWEAIWIENTFLKVMVLPEIGGRIHVGQDKTNGYNFFYRQDVIKPALVGLAGPWISGGVEFNWPQHHRPATFMPVDVEIEHHRDGAVTVWCGDHDPMSRMKGMHGICLHPDKAFIELKVRVYNRTLLTQTFLWWANVATRVHEAYQSFFPPDVSYVADHARRSMSEYPLCQGHYYGVNYGERAKKGVPEEEIPPHYIPSHCGGKAAVDYVPNDISFYSNIPVPTSYMCVGSQEDFFGGYDHREQAGVVHIANHHISPGKKQWTWGNHNFGYAWDRNLTDAQQDTGEFAPYIEIMAGVYTNNQPDFTFLTPGETKSWSQYWYPIQKIGPCQHANLQAALSLRLENKKIHLGVSVTSAFPSAMIECIVKKKRVAVFTRDLAPDNAWTEEIVLPKSVSETDVLFRVSDADGKEIISYQPRKKSEKEIPSSATEPPCPQEVGSVDELYLIGLHLEQYRHATREPVLYWQEGLRRDAGDTRCNLAMGAWHLRRGEFEHAETHLRRSIARLTSRNDNPNEGEPFYLLGQTLRHLKRDEEAYAAFYKSIWNQAWQAAGYYALAELDCKQRKWTVALDHLDRSLKLNIENLGARNLKALVLCKLGRSEDAVQFLAETRRLDPLDWCSRYLSGESIACDMQTRLDIVLDFARAGFYEEGVDILSHARPEPGVAPLVSYYLGWLSEQLGDEKAAIIHFCKAEKASPDYCFPARLEEISILEAAMQRNSKDPQAPYYLGNLFYDRKRHRNAITVWEKSAKLNPNFSCVWRNLGIAYFNILKKPTQARAAYNKAFHANSQDVRVLFERDQLWKRTGVSPKKRLQELEKHTELVVQRDDLSVELCTIYNQIGRHSDALALLSSRKFQPWEGGEGQALGQYVRTHMALGRVALEENNTVNALYHFQQALGFPENLGEAKHLLANQSDVRYWLGVALEKSGDHNGAKRQWQLSSEFQGDFQEMSVRIFSEMTYYSARAFQKLGQPTAAQKLLQELLAYGKKLAQSRAKIDYFATSLPTLLLFEDDLQFRQETTALFLQAQALAGLGRRTQAGKQMGVVLDRDPNHSFAKEFLSQWACETKYNF